jgi:hypothetical protein
MTTHTAGVSGVRAGRQDVAVAKSNLPALYERPSPPLTLFVGGGVMTLVILALVALTPWMAGLASDSAVASVPTTTPTVISATPKSASHTLPPRVSAAPTPLAASAAVAALTGAPTSPRETVALVRGVTSPSAPVTPSQVTGGQNEQAPTDTPTKYSADDVRLMQQQITYQNAILADQHAIIGLLTSHTLTTQAGAAANPELLSVPPGTPTLAAPASGSPDSGVSANIATDSNAPEYTPPTPSLHPGPWTGWHVYGMSDDAVMLADTQGDLRVVHRGDTFLGVRLLRVDASQNRAYTTAGVVHSTPQ